MALGIEYLPTETLRPQAVLPAETSNPLTKRIQLIKAAIGETLAPLAYERPGVLDFKTTYTPRVTKPLSRIREALVSAPARVGIAFAERKANQLLVDLQGAFAKEYYDTLEVIDHHGKSHVKRTRAGIELIDQHAPEIPLPQWVKDAQLRFAGEHDANQAYQEYRIRNGDLSATIDSKYGHGIGGAVMSLAMYKEYARVLHISEQEAKKISYATALMEIAHDVPNQIKQAIGLTDTKQQTAAALKEQGGFDAIKKGFATGTVDIFSLSPQNMILLLQDIKQKKGFDTPLGLGPVFEEEFANVLAELSTDSTPLLQNISQKDKQAIRYATLIAVVADMMDMILPNDEAFARMLTVPRAIKYPLAWKLPREKEQTLPKTPEALREFAAFFAPFGPEFWDKAQQLSGEELTFLRQILEGNAVTNAERKLLEAYEIGNIIHNTPLADNPTIATMMQHYQAMTLVDIRHQVKFFMSEGREGITHHVHEIFDKQLQAISSKLGPNHHDVAKWKEKLSEEAAFVIDCLSQKEGGIHVYYPEEVSSFEKVSYMVEYAFWLQQAQSLPKRRNKPLDVHTYAISQMQEAEERYNNGERPVTPTKNYHSTGSIRNARTIYPAAIIL